MSEWRLAIFRSQEGWHSLNALQLLLQCLYRHMAKKKKTAFFSLSYCNQVHNLHQVGPLPYSPEQVLMGAHSSSAKIWGWAVTQRKCLNGSTIPEQGPTPDVKLAAMGPNRFASLVRPCFVEASPTVEKAVWCYKVDQLVASLLSFHSVQSSPAVREFRAAREERCEHCHGQVCANLMSWRPKHIRAM